MPKHLQVFTVSYESSLLHSWWDVAKQRCLVCAFMYLFQVTLINNNDNYRVEKNSARWWTKSNLLLCYICLKTNNLTSTGNCVKRILGARQVLLKINFYKHLLQVERPFKYHLDDYQWYNVTVKVVQKILLLKYFQNWQTSGKRFNLE